MYYVCKPTKIQLYINTGRKSASAIKKELGCDVLINGGLFDMTRFTPNCWLRADGRTLHMENWSDFGFGWDTDELVLNTSDNVRNYDNFISCVCIVKDGKTVNLYNPPELGGRRGRSAIGVRADGSVIVFCTQDGTSWAMTPDMLQAEMRSLGAVNALMLDGGGSSQCIFPNGSIPSQRIVHNYIAVWTQNTQTANPQIPACPYTEPKHNVRWGSIGEGARWVQWQLNRHGANLDVDGWFFGQSVEALRRFQHEHGLAWDGICGEKTREELRK